MSAKKFIPFKRWVAEEAMRLHVSVRSVYASIYDNRRPMPPRRHINQRVILVEVQR